MYADKHVSRYVPILPYFWHLLCSFMPMADVHTAQQRNFNMQQIKGKNTKPEMLVRTFLHAQGYHYKLNDREPDLCGTQMQSSIAGKSWFIFSRPC